MVELDILIPIYNESKNILKLIPLLKNNISINFRIIFCYDNHEDDIFVIIDQIDKYQINYKLVKNLSKGPCEAVKTGFNYSDANCCIVYPADDFNNYMIINKMYQLYVEGNEIVVPSRFIEGGEMKGCPILKAVLVRLGNYTLYKFSNVGVRDSSNGFRLFSKKVLKDYSIESKIGFTYSIELLVKASKDGLKISEIPSKWNERNIGESNFKVFKWINSYLYWYLYAIKNKLLKS
jgi:glycosyltransferase involved in cell wall biosynthesis